ncbi:hypothetical protein [Thauera humireducens]|uniref:Uncharacterized protein n=1 Tax=Thauera humireducens TaxID=1134435 RepID=A0A127K3V3_9RHOO|nr:hypothetical protein [Thauera humireducens]AMO36635.1 hypothetical protein AC731_006580 [Thauera humireducens]
MVTPDIHPPPSDDDLESHDGPMLPQAITAVGSMTVILAKLLLRKGLIDEDELVSMVEATRLSAREEGNFPIDLVLHATIISILNKGESS